ncbi:MAG TPA: HAMP domain-containing protein [Candidatus Acidoferrum sp.]|nr:HAMP domain-containing protein [Candidatus Acidoferrum sp.]
MESRIRRSFRVLAPGSSLRRRVAYSLAIVRLILVPVIVLAVYYLFQIGFIVDRIVSYDAPAATLAQQATIEMLDARRAERNYLLVNDPASLQSVRDSIARIEQILNAIRDLNPSDQELTQQALDALHQYRQRFETAVALVGTPGQAPADRINAVVEAYERDLDNLLKNARYKSRAQLVDELRKRVDSFDAQISKTVQEGNPALRQITIDLQNSGQEVLSLASQLEARNWGRIESDHHKAQRLISRAEWSLGIVSVITFLVSVWISFILPRQVVKPLLSLKEAVDHAAAGNYEIEFDIQGEGEVAELANSIRNLIAHVREVK